MPSVDWTIVKNIYLSVDSCFAIFNFLKCFWNFFVPELPELVLQKKKKTKEKKSYLSSIKDMFEFSQCYTVAIDSKKMYILYCLSYEIACLFHKYEAFLKYIQ